jgi:hypothetical protein
MTAYIKAVTVAVMIALALVLLSSASWGQEHQHPTGETITPAQGRLYDTWRMLPHRTTSCCHKQDCYPVEAQMRGGVWFFKHRESGQWRVVPANRVEDGGPDSPDNPDGRNYVCASPNPDTPPFCFMPGGGT